MIYVITPYITDAKVVCEREGIECPILCGQLKNKNIIWIYDWQQLCGRKIFKIDKIIYGDLIYKFEAENLTRIKMEIELRKR